MTVLVVDACAETHRRLGPGLPADAYVEALSHEVALRGAPVQVRVSLPVFYRGVRLGASHRLDVCVAGVVAVDVRVNPLEPVHRAELRAKLRIGGLSAGVLVNFRTARIGEQLVVVRCAAVEVPGAGLRGRPELPASLPPRREPMARAPALDHVRSR